MSASVIRIHADAPAKPAAGAPCNGCGVCCLAQPCPIGILVSGRRTGACAALRWDAPRYRCGLIASPQSVLGSGRGWLARLAERTLSRMARRWIAAGIGCDSDAEVLAGPPGC